MRKPLTLFETLIAAVLAALLFSNLLSMLFRLTKTKQFYTVDKTETLEKASLHLRLKQLLSSSEKELNEETFSVQDGTLFFEEIPLTTGVLQMEITPFYREKGTLFSSSTWIEKKPIYALQVCINSDTYTIFLQSDTEGFSLCK